MRLVDLEHSEECGKKYFEHVLQTGQLPEFMCPSYAALYALKVGRLDEFATKLAWLGVVDYTPTAELIDDCSTAVARPIAVKAFYAISVGMLNVPITKGYAFLTMDEYIELTRRLLEKSAKQVSTRRRPEPKEEVKPSGGQTYNISSATMPPCVANILSQLERGIEVPHSARFLVVTYFNYTYRHLPVDDRVRLISSLFQNSPDYNPKITEYQVKHIIGQAGGRREYSVPTCQWIKSEGYCVADCGVKSPIQFLRRRKTIIIK